ncbi:MAG TPA: ThiF family adenylyltransferase [Planctomycetota bacterium]|nr:ThiF family adenylyltransferase [Planctomycetota bacterium]
MLSYEALTLRNQGYISAGLQAKIRATRLLVAGCGLGSMTTELAARTGFERFTLVDADEVAGHNLNRQGYAADDVGRPKVEALAARLRAVNPGVQVEARKSWVKADNAAGLVAGCDLVLDTIDFLDLPAIIALHDHARLQGRPLVSAFSAGWGAVAAVFTPQSGTLRGLCGLPESGSVAGASYPEAFGRMLAGIATQLPADFVAVTRHTLMEMADGRPCPAPQLAAGAAATAALMVALAVRLLAGQPVTVAPKMLLVDMAGLACGPGIRVVSAEG